MLENNILCKNVTSSYPFTGNIVPAYWIKIIQTSRKKPDLLAISLFAEIIYWTRKSSTNNWQTSYRHFEKKFDYNKESIRRALVRLENLNIITRNFLTIEVRGQKYNNVLFIKVNHDHELVAPIFNIKNVTIRKNFSNPIHKMQEPSPQIVGDIYKDYKKENRSRSNESSFNKNLDYFEKPHLSGYLTTQQSSLADDKIIKVADLQKSIADFYPLNDQDIQKLNQAASKEFSLNFVNQLVLKLASKYPNHKFINRERFIKYMTKVLEKELLQSWQVNNESFKFKTNEEKVQEKFFEKIENSQEITEEARIKRKLIASLETKLAYEFLCGLKIINKGNEIIFQIRHPENIRENIKNIIYDQARAVYGRSVEKITITSNQHVYSMSKIKSEFAGTVIKNQLIYEQDIWHKVRKKLIEWYGEGSDKSWFSQIEVKEDNETKILALNMPTTFIRDWIKQHYGNDIDKLCQNFNMKVSYA